MTGEDVLANTPPRSSNRDRALDGTETEERWKQGKKALPRKVK